MASSMFSPANTEDQSHCEREIDIGVRAPKKGSIDFETLRRPMSPTNGSHARDQSDPVRRQNKDEDGGKEPECPPDQSRPDNALKKQIETFNHPLPESLCAVWNCLHIACRKLSEHDQTDGNDPT